jgi:putative transposase
MPEPLWIYLMAVLYFTNITTCSAIADAFDSVSHDRLTRMLHGSWSGHTLLDLALRTLFAVMGGYLIIDDTVVDKTYAKWLGEAAWVWSSKHNKVVFGVSVVLLVWTDGQVRIPLAFRCWYKGGPSKGELALELLSYARNRLRCKPQFVLFDSWYPSKKLLKRLRDYGWYFICQLKKNRHFEGAPLSRYLCNRTGTRPGCCLGS